MTTTRTISPTEIDFFAEHSTDTLRSLVERYTATSRYIAVNSGANHPLAIDAMSTANAAWGQLVMRGEA